MNNLPLRPAGDVRAEISFSIDENSIFRVRARIHGDNIPEEIRVKLMESLGVTNKHIDEALR